MLICEHKGSEIWKSLIYFLIVVLSAGVLIKRFLTKHNKSLHLDG